MLSIKKLENGDTVHLILTNGFHLELIFSTSVGYVWKIVSQPAGAKQSQATSSDEEFAGFKVVR